MNDFFYKNNKIISFLKSKNPKQIQAYKFLEISPQTRLFSYLSPPILNFNVHLSLISMKQHLLPPICTLIFLIFLSFPMQAQKKQVPATKAIKRLVDFDQRKSLQKDAIVQNIPFRSVGPTIMSGRVTDLAVNPQDPTHFYVAYASGGLWETKNNGTTFTPLFDNEAVMTIGDIAVNWSTSPQTIWVGTGENNSSRSSYAGMGMYKSVDGGKNWLQIGLLESHHIGRIVLHPTNAETAWVAVLGHLYSSNEERGIYKTTDGGNTWKQTLYVDENTGGIDLLMEGKNPEVLFAAMWHKTRRAWDFIESGETSGIYRSVDGGENWSLMTTAESGFPTGNGVGRIGLAHHKDGGIFAILDNQDRRKKDNKDEDKDELTKDQLRTMSKENFLELSKEKIGGFLQKNRFPKKYSAEKIISMIKEGKIAPIALVEYLENANTQLFDTPVIGAEVYQSTDGGKSWNKTHEDYINDLYYSYGYYFGQIRVAPQNPDHIYIMGVPILMSQDGGKTFESINGDNVHADHHALWINPNKEGHLINGNDGGINISYDNGESWIKCNSPAVGQFYTVNVDMAEPYNIYGGLQDNGVWKGSSKYEYSTGWHQYGVYPYKGLMGGDGMQVAIDSRDNNTVYTGYQFGNYFRINVEKDDYERIQPSHELGERPLRFNWQTPIHLSIHHEDILYLGSNKFHRSMKQGDEWETLSGDLTKGGRKGDVPFGTLSTIHESPMKFGLIYVGSDDGNIHVTKDGGYNWTKISDKLPADRWVSRVVASAHQEGTVYASLNGYRSDDFDAYVYVSFDYGNSWKQIGKDLPKEPVNIIKEDPKNANLLYVGTDHGVYVSLDKGQTFMGMTKDLPAVPVHDLVIHPKANDLVIGTHGRSFYIAPVQHLQKTTPFILSKPLYVFDIESVKHSSRWGNKRNAWRDATTPKVKIPAYLKTTTSLQLEVQTADGLVLKKWEADASKGYNFIEYDLSVTADQVEAYEKELNKDLKEDEEATKVKEADNEVYYLQKGKYKVVIGGNGESVDGSLEIK